MPNIKSAKKRVLVNAKKRERNRSDMSEIKTAIKNYYNAIDTNNINKADELLPKLFALLDSASAKGLIHKNNAANKKSQAAKRLHDVKTGKIEIVIKKDNKTIAAEKAKLAQEARDAARAEYQKAAAEKKAKKAEELAATQQPEKKPAKATKAKAEKTEAPKAEKKPAKAPKAEKKPAKEEEAPAPKAEKKPAKAKEEKPEATE